MSSNAARFGRYVKERREALDMTQLELWQRAGGPSNTTLTKIEGGALETLTRSTARKLDRGLQWEPGSARRTWDGGEPTPLTEPAPRLTTELLEELERSDLHPEAKRHIRAVLEADAQRTAERGTA